jgi:hypothetical protein
MNLPDLINGLFEGSGGFLLANNVRLLLKHKAVKGVSIVTTAIFSCWGFWNLFYYPHLKQWLSFSGGILVVIANTTWVVLAIYYTRRKGHGPQ